VSERELVDAAASYLRTRVGDQALARLRLAIVLGSGLKEFAQRVEHAVVVPFDEIPHFPVPHVAGHGCSLVLGDVAGTAVACLTGRVHLYEGWQPAEVVRAVRTLRRIGVGAFLLTNAAGGIGDDLSAGDLMVIRDHLNLTGRSPLVGPHDAAFGPRFPDQTRTWSPRLSAMLTSEGARLRGGVYAGLLGPTYETPAEVRMLKQLGAHAVGMSTVQEAIALHAMGAEVVGVSLITNLAAGIGESPLSHDEVVAAGLQATAMLTATVTDFCRRLGAGGRPSA
jgi:purine-nucleoside phosphorylase